VRVHGGSRGCAGEVAAAYGDYPEIAAARMRWARTLVESTLLWLSSHGGGEDSE
jgi:hypothetical protein